MNPWPALVQFPGPSAVTRVWRKNLREAFEPFSTAFLDPDPLNASAIFCPRNCGCQHIVIQTSNTTFLAKCRCDPPRCEPLPLTLQDVAAFKPNWPRLERALCQAFSLDFKPGLLNLKNTRQIGSWSAQTIPVILTIHYHPQHFHGEVTDLIAQLPQPFILLSPTTTYLNAHLQGLLARIHAAVFSLEATVDMHPDGSLHPLRPPADLFAQFSPSAPSALTSSPATRHPSHPTGPRFSIRKGRRVWHITFDYEPAEFLHEQGASFFAYLLLHPPPTPLYGLDLLGKIPELYRQQSALTHIADPETGKLTLLESHARIQQRNLALDDKEAMRALLRKKQELEAITDSDDESEPVKAEASRELDAIYKYLSEEGGRSPDSAQRTIKAMQQSMRRFQRHQATALDKNGNPHQVLRKFADHIKNYILIPSARYAGHGGSPTARTGLAGCFTYEPPPGVSWSP